jgi:hypothetical protein
MPPETNAICTLSGSAEEMRAHEERLLQEGYVRVPAITPDVELLAFPSPPISPLSNTTITLTWRKKNEQS